MEYSQALSQISTIHEHLAKGEIYNGYRPLPIALTGVIGLAAAVLQPASIAEPSGFVIYWVVVAAVCICVGGLPIVRSWVQHADGYTRRRTWKVVGQFAPSILAGAVVTGVVMAQGAPWAPLLPGIWATLFALGVFSSKPYLPRESNWVGLYYLAAGGLLLWTWDSPSNLAGWRVGFVFGAGQLLCSLIILKYRETQADV